MNERTYTCATCGTEDTYLPEYYSFGIYAGRYCDDRCWSKSGYRDAVDPDAVFSEADAGERLDPEPYFGSDRDGLGWS